MTRVDRLSTIGSSFGGDHQHVVDSTFIGGGGVSGIFVTVERSTFRNVEGPVYGADDVHVFDSRFVRNRGTTLDSDRALTAYSNVLIDNSGAALSAGRGGSYVGNRIVRQGGDGIYYFPTDSGNTTLYIGDNRIVDGAGWGIVVDPDLTHDLGGNVARGNAHGQCQGVVCTRH